jgi:hypothetical protein
MGSVIGFFCCRNAVRSRRAQGKGLDSISVILHAQPGRPGYGTEVEQRAKNSEIDAIQHNFSAYQLDPLTFAGRLEQGTLGVALRGDPMSF